MMATGTKQSWARGGMIFAATLLFVIGVFQFFMGLAAIVQNNFFVVGPNYYYEIDTTAFGWIHLVIGVIAVVAACFLLTGAMWARVAGMAIVVISAISNFFFLPYYPLWSLLVIGMDIVAIWAIATAGTRDEFAQPPMTAGAGMGTPGMGGTYPGDTQAGERWPAENVPGRHWAPQDVKEGAGQTSEQAQEAARHAAQSGSQTGQQAGQPRPQDYRPPQ
jgi:hypothetical protein